MNTFRPIRILLFLFAVLYVAGLAGAVSGVLPLVSNSGLKRLDPVLRSLAVSPDRPVPSSVSIWSDTEGIRRVYALLKVKPEAKADLLSSLGIVVNGSGGIVSAEVPVSKLAELANWPSLVYAEAGRRSKPLLSRSIPAIQADRARTTFNRSGKGVLVGIVDTGIDITHMDFRTSAGRTRIKFLWDQTATQGPAPAGYFYGREYSEADINALLDQSTASPIRDEDVRDGITYSEGHGSEVAGVAAGGGGGTPFVGVAPEADLIIVKWRDDRGLDANRYIIQKAESLSRPVVVNNSWGGQNGPHDGTDNESTGISELIGAGKVGRVITFAAGNNGDTPVHMSGQVQPNERQETLIFAPNGQTEFEIEVWADARARYQFGLSYPLDINDQNRGEVSILSGERKSFELPDSPMHPYARASVTLDANDLPYPLNPGTQRFTAYVNLENTSARTIQGLNWAVTLRRLNSEGGNEVDGWLTLGYDRLRFATNATPVTGNKQKTLVNQACARDVIAVGSFITTPDPKTPTNEQGAGAVSSFSAQGPTRTGVQKPDIIAPGEWVASSLSREKAANLSVPAQAYRTPDGKHYYSQGTSLAAPHVTGTAALMLEANPGMDAPLVVNLIRWAGSAPSNWTSKSGSGKLNAFEGVRLATFQATHKRGDLNWDNEINLIDAVASIRMALKLIPTRTEDLVLGDVAPAATASRPSVGDGQITVEDTVRILRYITGLEPL